MISVVAEGSGLAGRRLKTLPATQEQDVATHFCVTMYGNTHSGKAARARASMCRQKGEHKL